MNFVKNKSYIIAEIGVNHDGLLSKAKKLIDLAKKCQVDAVKFQLFDHKNLTTKKTKVAPYQKKNVVKSNTQFNLLKKLQLSYSEILILKKYTENKNIDFICSAFDIESLSFLNSINVKFFKIPSGEIDNYPYLRQIASFNKNIIMSVGMSTIKEIKNSIAVLKKNGTSNNKIAILQCNTEYPTPLEDVNLNVITTFKKKLNIKNIGYSDHTKGIEISLAAVAMGAKIIEKHFTLSNNSIGPDHKASLEPKEFAELVRQIRNIDRAKGSFEKKNTKSELKNKKLVRKSIVASKLILKGQKFTEDNLTTKRPGTGLSPMKWKTIIGRKSKYKFNEDDLIKI